MNKFAKWMVTSMLLAIPILAGAQSIDYITSIDVAPNVLNLENQGTVMTIHTDISYSDVVGASCFLNGVEIQSYKADNRGYFVAKFNIDDVKGLPLTLNAMNTLTLTGQDKDGYTFWGSQEIKVIKVLPKKKNKKNLR